VVPLRARHPVQTEQELRNEGVDEQQVRLVDHQANRATPTAHERLRCSGRHVTELRCGIDDPRFRFGTDVAALDLVDHERGRRGRDARTLRHLF
jgi:hypothetical protein